MERPTARADAESERIRLAYERRDALPHNPYSFARAGYQFYLEQLEWRVLQALRAAEVRFIGADVLEIGCGSGYFLHRFKDFGAERARGIDLSQGRVDDARRRYPTLEVVCGDAAELPWEDSSFDLVTQFTCLSSVLDPDVRARIASEMWRVLRPAGAILSYDIRPTPVALRSVARVLNGRPDSDADGATPTRPVSDDELRSWFPDGAVSLSTGPLHFDLCSVAARSRPVASALGALPLLSTHRVAVIQRPRAHVV